MDRIETSATPHGSRWTAALTCAAFVLLIAVGGMVTLQERVAVSVQEAVDSQNSERDKLVARLDGLQRNLDTLASQPAPDGESLAALDTKLNELAAKLDTIAARVDALEQKPAPAIAPVAIAPPPPTPAVEEPPAPITNANFTALKLAILSGKPFAAELAVWSKQHPEAAKQTFALGAVAESGIASEADLNRKLRAALDDATADKKVEDTSVAGKINTHLAGLVSIKKSGQAGIYDALRRDVLRDDITTLTRGVEALDDAARKPLEPWLAEARARRDALEALTKLDNGSAL